MVPPSRSVETKLRRFVGILLGLQGLAVVLLPAVLILGQLPGTPAPVDVPAQPEGAGSVVSAETLPNVAWMVSHGGIDSAKIVYKSTDAVDGSETEVSGTVFVPQGAPPDGGWPVISYAHGTTGIDQPCAPSRSKSLLGGAALVAGYAKAGYAVAIADYQGLGHRGPENQGAHVYLDSKTAGFNVIDAVRALRNLFPNVSTRWAAFGGSQGGGAAWAANEQAASYAPELDLVGSVSLAPASDMTGIVVKADAGTLTADQGPVLQWLIESRARRYPDLDRDNFRTGAAAENWDVLSLCNGPDIKERATAASELGPRDFTPKTSEAKAQLTDLLARDALPQLPASAPMLVVYGSADTYIDAEWTTAALQKACALGDSIEFDEQPGKGHGDLDGAAVQPWLNARFQGDAATSDCAAS